MELGAQCSRAHSRLKGRYAGQIVDTSPERRPRFNPLFSHVVDMDAARRIARFDADAEKLSATFWPGPLTLVLPKADRCPVSELATAGLDSIAVRIPDHPVAQEILRGLRKPVVAPSANQSGHVSPTT